MEGPERARFTLVFDGGSRGNPGQAYGSFRLQRQGAAPSSPRRLRFGRGTNNEAEYRTLIQGLRALLDECRNAGLDPRQVRLDIRGDSLLVIRQVEGAWKVRDPRMRELCEEARELLVRFGTTHLAHQARSRSVAALGH
jgi:ribonuclease HI